MDSTKMLSVFFSLFFLGSVCGGYEQGCEANVTLYVIEGSTAELTTEDVDRRIDDLEFVNTSYGLRDYIFHADRLYLFDLEFRNKRIRFNIPSLESRIDVTSYDRHRLTIVFKDIKPSDNGTYLLTVDGIRDFCWTLFVICIEMDIRSQHIAYLAEGTYLRLKGNPASSVVDALSLNISVVWLFDGLNENETENFHVTGDWMWITHVTREQDGKNVTYRLKHGNDVKEVNLTLNVFYIETDKSNGAVQDGSFLSFRVNRQVLETVEGEEATVDWMFDGRFINESYSFLVYKDLIMIPHITREMNGKNVTYKVENGGRLMLTVNLTLEVEYGPSWPLNFKPPKTAYYLTPGETLPEITCEIDCNPSCNISWGEFSSGNNLKFGKVSKDSTGTFICRASREGSATVIERSLYLYIQDTPSTTLPFAVLGGLLALSILALICVVVCLCCRRYNMSNEEPNCIRCFKKKGTPTNASNISSAAAGEDNQMGSAQRNFYEALDRGGTGSENATYSEMDQDSGAYINTDLINVSAM